MRYSVVEEAVKMAAPKDSRQRRLLLETIRYYYNNPRAENDGRCEYESANGATCAVGRCMLVRKRRSLKGENTISVSSIGREIAPLDSFLRVKYRGLSMDFWNNLQMLHDSASAWNQQGARGMTLDGARVAVEIAADLCPDSYHLRIHKAMSYLGEKE